MTEEEKTVEPKEEVKKFKRSRDNDNVVFIGGKPFMNYVTGVVMQFTTEKAKDIIIKARGKFISRAVDVAEVATRRFLENSCELGDIKINSEEFQNKEGKDIRVSTIEITLKRK
jgi:archaea-specific DNA-binding protein